ncbi:MAG: PEGA domain-containing protein [Methanoregula sp.]|jgi:hypothetical protein|uniref:PEGA domain-containing protein n=1 Tax=Methanoregula sp. TaxID=2052170 RepID=UPI003D14B864
MKRILIISALIICVVISGCISSQPAGKSTLQFSTSPEGAQIYLDNQYHGTTPSTLSDVSTGVHSLEFRYPGYQSWKANITVTAASSTYSAALAPLVSQTKPQSTQSPGEISTQGSVVASVSQPAVKILESQDIMIIGSSQTFYGTCTGSDTVILMLYGPGAYTNGIVVAMPSVGVDNSWSYTWNPGYSLMSGTYVLIAYDKQEIASDKAIFSVVGGGKVSITTSNYVIGQGDTVTYSGLCTTGAKSVTLTLFGPGQYSNGAEVATLTLNADNTWSYKYKFDLTKPLGSYIMTVHDAQNTASDSVAITLMNS